MPPEQTFDPNESREIGFRVFRVRRTTGRTLLFVSLRNVTNATQNTECCLWYMTKLVSTSRAALASSEVCTTAQQGKGAPHL